MLPMPSNNAPVISQIIRSNRKSFSIELTPDGRLIVRAPKYASNAQIEAVIAKKAAWIEKARLRQAENHAHLQPKTFTPGETFWYLGKLYPLRLTNRQRPPLDLDGAFYLSRQHQSQAKDVFIAWYRHETRQITQQMIDTYSQRYGFKVNQVRITSARTRWGSCSGKGNLNFTYRLCMAPLAVVEYVVAHELAHLKVPNHSRAFWGEVARINPSYQTSRAWLKKYGLFLRLD
jgi:predicted metal-dependent hydrolase